MPNGYHDASASYPNPSRGPIPGLSSDEPPTQLLVPIYLTSRRRSSFLAGILASLLGSGLAGAIHGAEPLAHRISGTVDLWWLESGVEHFGPHPITGHLAAHGRNRFSAVTAHGRSSPVKDALIYSTDGTDALVVSARPEFLELAQRFEPNTMVGFGFVTAGPLPRHSDPSVPVDDVQLIALALRLFAAEASEPALRDDIYALNLIRKSPLLPADGLPRSAYRIKAYTNSTTRLSLHVEAMFPGSGTHREEKYEYAYPGPFMKPGYVGFALHLAGTKGVPSTLRIDSTNYVPRQSTDVQGAPYDSLQPTEAYQVALTLSKDGDAAEPTRLAMQPLKLAEINDHRHADTGVRATGIRLASTNAWPGRQSREFEATSEDAARKAGSGRKFRWIFAFMVVASAMVIWIFGRREIPRT